MKIIINKEFSFTPKNIKTTPNMALVAQTFNIPLTESKKFTIFKDFEIDLPAQGIVYIHGQSGSGKSVLLGEIAKKLKETIWLKDINLDPQKSVIDYLGLDFNTTLFWLSQIGLNEAFIMLRQADQLSDGQKYRARLAIALSKYQIIFIDEFCANLDRVTAKIIAYNLRKLVINQGKRLIVATTHDDLKEDLSPEVEIECVYGETPKKHV